MKFHLLYASSVSACFELENANPYYAETAYDVTVNGAPALLGVRTNVFSLFDLEPEKEYSVAVGEESITFTTSGETGCISVKDFGAVGDGTADDTDAIQNAIHCCPVGGRVTVPAGTYYVRPLVLKSHITLELRKAHSCWQIPARSITQSFPARSTMPRPVESCRSAPGRAIPSLAVRASSAPIMRKTSPLLARALSTAMQSMLTGGWT